MSTEPTTMTPSTTDGDRDNAIPFLRLVFVELRKSADTRAGRWLLAAIVAITALFMAIFFAVADAEDRLLALHRHLLDAAGLPAAGARDSAHHQ